MEDIKQIKLARKNFEKICEMLDDSKWKYDKDEENLKIFSGAKGDDMMINIRFQLNPELEIVGLLSNMPFEVPEDKRSIMALAVSRANHGMIDGNFDYNYVKGSLLFRITLSYAGTVLSKDTYDYMLSVACHTVNIYNQKFLTVCQKNLTIKQLNELIN